MKGVGDYTAAAICSFAYDMPCAVVDGNVYRVISRWMGVEEQIDTNSGKNYLRSWLTNCWIKHSLHCIIRPLWILEHFSVCRLHLRVYFVLCLTVVWLCRKA